jgi:hypothetical protein
MDDLTLATPVDRLRSAVGKLPQIDAQTQHAITGGMYARTIMIPAGSVIVGLEHLKDHINVMSGDITGFLVMECKAGHARSGFAHADTYWSTIVRTDETELEAIEGESVKHPEMLQTRTLKISQENKTCLGQQ